MIPDVFISHSTADGLIADRVCNSLEAQDVKCWLPRRDVPPGQDQAASIGRGIDACRTMVVIFSRQANDSEQVRSQVERAIQMHKVLIVLRIDAGPATGEMEARLRHRYTIDASAAPLENQLDLLGRVLKPLTHQLVPKAAPMNTISGTLPAISSSPRRSETPVLPVRTEANGPLRIFFNFNHVVVKGFPATVQMRLENRGAAALDDVEVAMESRGLQRSANARWPAFAPGQAERFSFEIEPVRSGSFVLRVTVKCRAGRRQLAFTGSRPIRINEPLATSDLLGSMKNLLGAPEAPEASTGLRELLSVELPENFEPLDLALDYEVGVDAQEQAAARAPLEIPPAFLGHAPLGTVLKLEPLDGSAATPYQEIRLVGRPGFGLGRSREESDFLLWFWPRNDVHDVKTRRISKRHCTLTVTEDGISIGNAPTTGRTSFDGQEITEAEGAILGGGGTLNLSGIYLLDVTRFPAQFPEGPAISNLDQWSGDPAGPRPVIGGSVRFLPLSPHVLSQSATWLLTDGTFGTSFANPLILEQKGVAEIQGRFYHYLGAFWVENLADNGAVRVGGQSLKPGYIVPLGGGQTVQLGDKTFRATVER